MTLVQKPRVCIALPGINYLHDTTYVINTLPIVNTLRDEFEITLVFRAIASIEPPTHPYLTILAAGHPDYPKQPSSDAYFSPSSPLRAFRYIQEINRFARNHAADFDLIIERQWVLVGALAHAFAQHGVPTISIHEAEFYTASAAKLSWRQQFRSKLSQQLFSAILPRLRQRWMTQTRRLIVETEQMKPFLLAQQRAAPIPISAIPNGIDPEIFYPRDRQSCRDQLGIAPDVFVMTYVGSLNRFIQEPGPVIEALGRVQPPNTVLHVVGDGNKRGQLKAIAQQRNAPVFFHGKLPQTQAALYIGAADLCLAPYNKSLFPQQVFTSASLKVCEYLACGRLVVTIPCDRMTHLLQAGRYGFYVENQLDAYCDFLATLPTQATLASMETSLLAALQSGQLAAQDIVMTWADIAQRYRTIIQATLALPPNS